MATGAVASLPEDAMGLPSAAPPGAANGNRRAEPLEMGKVFVGGLSRETTTDGLRLYFERFGDISDCVVMKDRSTGAPRGFGFVTYASQMIADRVIHHRHIIDGKEVEAKPAVPRDSDSLVTQRPTMPPLPGMPVPGFPPPPQHAFAPPPMFNSGVAPPPQQQEPVFTSNKIFVGGLSHETSESDFVAYFGLYGQVVDCVIMCDPHTRKPRGFGFITYDSVSAVDRACVHKFHELQGKRVEVKRAIPQDRMGAEDHGMDSGFNSGFMKGGGGGGRGGGGGGGGGFGGRGGGGVLPHANPSSHPNSHPNNQPPNNNPNSQGPNNGFRPTKPSQPHQQQPAPQQVKSSESAAQSAGLDTALSMANSVLSGSERLAEPAKHQSVEQVPNGLLSAFQNPSNFASATAALSSGLRAGYGNKSDTEEAPPAMANGSSSPEQQQLVLAQLQQHLLHQQSQSQESLMKLQHQHEQQQLMQQQAQQLQKLQQAQNEQLQQQHQLAQLQQLQRHLAGTTAAQAAAAQAHVAAVQAATTTTNGGVPHPSSPPPGGPTADAAAESAIDQMALLSMDQQGAPPP